MRYFFLPIAILLLAVACRKDKDYTKATVIDTGNISSTGCGYLLLLQDGSFEKPDYLPSAFQHDSVKVKFSSHSTGTQSNCRPQQPLDVVIIDDMERDL